MSSQEKYNKQSELNVNTTNKIMWIIAWINGILHWKNFAPIQKFHLEMTIQFDLRVRLSCMKFSKRFIPDLFLNWIPSHLLELIHFLNRIEMKNFHLWSTSKPHIILSYRVKCIEFSLPWIEQLHSWFCGTNELNILQLIMRIWDEIQIQSPPYKIWNAVAQQWRQI